MLNLHHYRSFARAMNHLARDLRLRKAMELLWVYEDYAEVIKTALKMDKRDKIVGWIRDHKSAELACRFLCCSAYDVDVYDLLGVHRAEALVHTVAEHGDVHHALRLLKIAANRRFGGGGGITNNEADATALWKKVMECADPEVRCELFYDWNGWFKPEERRALMDGLIAGGHFQHIMKLIHEYSEGVLTKNERGKLKRFIAEARAREYEKAKECGFEHDSFVQFLKQGELIMGQRPMYELGNQVRENLDKLSEERQVRRMRKLGEWYEPLREMMIEKRVVAYVLKQLGSAAKLVEAVKQAKAYSWAYAIINQREWLTRNKEEAINAEVELAELLIANGGHQFAYCAGSLQETLPAQLVRRLALKFIQSSAYGVKYNVSPAILHFNCSIEHARDHELTGLLIAEIEKRGSAEDAYDMLSDLRRDNFNAKEKERLICVINRKRVVEETGTVKKIS